MQLPSTYHNVSVSIFFNENPQQTQSFNNLQIPIELFEEDYISKAQLINQLYLQGFSINEFEEIYYYNFESDSNEIVCNSKLEIMGSQMIPKS